MGKKSRKAKQNGRQRRMGGGGTAPVVAAAVDSSARVPPTPPTGASCWICLDGDLDDGGKPIVRDCSCRGDDAGFAHLSCLVKYAEMKTKELEKTNVPGGYLEPWKTCPNCCHEYQRQVALDMAQSLLAFLDVYTPGNKIAQVGAYSLTMDAIMKMDLYSIGQDMREKGRCATNKMISLIHEMGDHSLDATAHKMLGYTALAKFAAAEETNDGYELALHYYQKVVDFHLSQGNEFFAKQMKIKMEKVKSKRDSGEERPCTDQELQDMRDFHEAVVREHGEGDTVTVAHGVNLLQALLLSQAHGFECERLASKLATISRRVHGPDHELTRTIEHGLAQSRARIIVKVQGNVAVNYDVLRSSDDGRKYIVKKRNSHDERASREVSLEDGYILIPGTPVILHGLKGAAHLNGKLGDVRGLHNDARRYVMRFEDRSLNTASVKPANLRIAFELPDPDES